MSKAKVYALSTINGTIELDIAGGYFKLMTAPTRSIGVELLNDGNQALVASSVPAGFYQRGRFNKVRITDTGVQAITFLAADAEGGSDNFTGTFTIAGPLLGDNADAAAAAGASSLVGVLSRLQGYNGATFDRLRTEALAGGLTGVLAVSDRAVRPGSAFSATNNVGAATNDTIFLAATNAAGAIVHKAEFLSCDGTGVGGGKAYISDTGAPGAMTSGSVVASTRGLFASGVFAHLGWLDYPGLYIPLGNGLWYRNGGNAETIAFRHVRYSLLT